VRQTATVDEAAEVQHAVTHLRRPWKMGGLRVRCVECGGESAEVARFCVRCGAPVTGQPLVAADPAAGGPDDHLETAPGPAKDATPVPAALRWLCLICLILCLILFAIGQVGVVATPRGSGLHNTMVGISWLSIFGALAFLVFFEAARTQFARAQPGVGGGAGCVLCFLAFTPFLWLALVRRRVGDWVVLAIYLAATVRVVAAFSAVPANTSITGFPAVTWSLLMVIAPVHALLAFSPTAKVPTWRDAYPARAVGKRQQPDMDAIPPEDWRQDTDPGYSKPIPTDSS
jgi:hypothetical protein